MNYYELSTYKEELQKIIESNTSISKLKGKSIVITGARGLIGSVITDAILQANLTLNLDCKVYAVVRNVEKAKEAMEGWAALILEVEGEGDYDRAKSYAAEHGVIRPQLQADLSRISEANIPIDIRYDQGLKALGLAK